MNIYKFIKSECGSGKTHCVIKLVNATPQDKYIIVQGKIDLLNQTFSTIKGGKLINAETEPCNVERAINDFLLNSSSRVLGITSKSFFKIDPSLLVGWKIFLDDVVNFHKYKSINEGNVKIKSLLEEDIFQVSDAVSNKYDLVLKKKDIKGELCQLLSKSFEEIDINDHFIINNSYFNKKSIVIDNVTISTYDNVAQLTMLGWIDITKYSNCDLTFMANRFDESLLYKSNPNMFVETTFDGLRKRLVPVSQRLKVKYFSKKKVLSKDFRNVHRECFDKVVAYIDNELKDKSFYYTRNDKETFTMRGEYVPVDTRGMNNLLQYDTCVWMASCRPYTVEAKMTELFFGISGDDLVSQREYQSLEQFVQRGVLRDFYSTTVMTVYVFDEQQALSLGTTNIEYIDLGIDDIKSKQVGHPRSEVPLNLRNAFSQWFGRKSDSDNILVLYKKWKAKQIQKYPDEDFSSFDEKIWEHIQMSKTLT